MLYPRNGYTAAIGDASTETITVTHNLATLNVAVTVRTVTTGRAVIVEWVAVTTNTIVLYFSTAPATGAYQVEVTRV